MEKMAPLSCAVIGEGNIALSCLRHLLESGFCIDVVITNYQDMIQHCIGWNIETFPRRKTSMTSLKERSFDYLFSINNPTILDREVLSMANVLTINYHDSLLPSYAGVNATSWAILAGEKVHGISWHVVEAGIDTGNILQSSTVEIDAMDSALSLNLKCSEACSEAFRRLVEDIKRKTLRPVPQNFENRSYFGLYEVPPNLGVLVFNQEAEAIFNLARAMEFGPHDNQFGSPKICTANGTCLLVTNAKMMGGEFDGTPQNVQTQNGLKTEPGTILDVADKIITVATSTQPLILTLAELDGHPLETHSLHTNGIEKGALLPSLTDLDRGSATPLRKKEAFWKKTMKSYNATTFFVQKLNVLPDIIDGSKGQPIQSTRIPIQNTFYTSMQRFDSKDMLVAAFVAFLGRSCCSSQVHVGLVTLRNDIPRPYQQLYSRICPAVFNIDYSQCIENVMQRTIRTLNFFRESGTFLVDMLYRYPDLKGINKSPRHNIAIALEGDDQASSVQAIELLRDCQILISISPDCMTVSYVNKLANSYFRVEDVLRHFPAFLHSMSALSKSASLMNVDLLSPSEKGTLYVRPQFKTWEESDDIVNRISNVAKKFPEKSAITTTDTRVSFCDLLDEVNNLCYCLQESLPHDYRTELKCIALHMPNSIAYVVSLLGVMSANCPFLPLPQNLPTHRLAFMLQDARAYLMLTTREIQNSDKFKQFQADPDVVFEEETRFGTLVLLRIKDDHTFSQWTQPSSQLPEVYSFTSLSELASVDDMDETPLHPDCCYVMYTSGSTGRPKGVQVLRSGVLNMALGQIDNWNLGPEDVIAQFASIGFDASISEIFTALLSGANLAVLQESERLGKEFTSVMTKLQVTTVTLPPSVLNIYKPTDFPKLQKVVTAGEACTVSTALRWTRNTNKRFFNAYGPTESTVCATIHEFDPSEVQDTLSKELSIGKAIQGTQVYLFDDFMKAVPPNVVGEVFIGGQGVSAGYTGHASSKNEERFVENPLYPGFTIYKTGDHALQDEDGRLTYIGRMDDQIKIRGQRVDLNEIEQVLLQHSKVEMAVVVKHQISPNSDATIAAFIAPTFVFISELREYLSKALPSYMIPGYITKMEIEDFPINLSGKIDRKKLERDQTFLRKVPDSDTSHLNETQLRTAKLWCQVLQLDESQAYSMHRRSSFVEHGGNSLHMVLLQRAIEKEFGVVLTFTEIGGASNIQDFSELINRQECVTSETAHIHNSMSERDLRNLIVEDSIFDPHAMDISEDDLYLVQDKPDGSRTPENMLLSGATGFLGAYLLHEILEQTNAHVCCMVRESTEVLGFGRIVSNLKKYHIWKTSYDARIAIVLSDISKPNLGIAPDIYKALSVSIDTVFMNAAKMNFNTDYFDHRTANVNGSKEFIKFCFTGRKKYLFTTSSLGVFLFPEKNAQDRPCHHFNGLDINGNLDDKTKRDEYVSGNLNDKTKRDEYVNGNLDDKTKCDEYVNGNLDDKTKRDEYVNVNLDDKTKRDEYVNGNLDGKAKRDEYVNGWINSTNGDNNGDEFDLEHTEKSEIKTPRTKHLNLTKTKSTYIEVRTSGASFKTNDGSIINGQTNNTINGCSSNVRFSHSVMTSGSLHCNEVKSDCNVNEVKSDCNEVKSDCNEVKSDCSEVMSDCNEVKRVTYYENDQVSDPLSLSGGYNQSKWASERLVQQALEYLPGGAIFRPARISGHSKTGVGPTNDLFASVLKGAESLKFAPDLRFPFDLTPVDYCSKGIVEIMTQIYRSDDNKMPVVYHFFNRTTIPFLDLFKEMMDVHIISLEEWRARLGEAGRDNVLVPFIPFIQSNFWDRSPRWPVFDTENTDRYTSKECKACLPASKLLLSVYREFFRKN